MREKEKNNTRSSEEGKMGAMLVMIIIISSTQYLQKLTLVREIL